MQDKLPVSLTGTITRFSGDGRKLGYPTANLISDTSLQDGVYFGYADMGELADHPALIFIGIPTTMGEKRRRVEAHLLDIADKDYYDLPLKLSLCHYHRPNQTFASVDRLREVLAEDEIAGRAWFTAQSKVS